MDLKDYAMQDKKLLAKTIIKVILLFILGMVLGYGAGMVHRLQSELKACKAEGLVECHIERDGLDYNVYGKGDEDVAYYLMSSEQEPAVGETFVLDDMKYERIA